MSCRYAAVRPSEVNAPSNQSAKTLLLARRDSTMGATFSGSGTNRRARLPFRAVLLFNSASSRQPIPTLGRNMAAAYTDPIGRICREPEEAGYSMKISRDMLVAPTLLASAACPGSSSLSQNGGQLCRHRIGAAVRVRLPWSESRFRPCGGRQIASSPVLANLLRAIK